MKNRIILLEDTYKTVLDEEDFEPKLDEDYVLIKIMSSGICGSDLHYFRNGGLGSFRQKMPISLGHEPSGLVIDSKSKFFKIYDRVAIEPGHSCGSCFFCNNNKINLCPSVKFLGANDVGALRDYIVVHHSQLVKISNDISFKKAALIEPFSVALHNIKLANIEKVLPSKKIAIIGGGSIGLFIFLLLKNNYPECEVELIENNYARKEILKTNFKISFNTFQSYFDKKYDIVFETGANQNSLTLSNNIVGPAAKIIFISIPETDLIELNPHKLRINEVQLIFSRRSAVDFNLLMDKFHSINIDENLFVTDVFSPSESQTAFDTADLRKCLKVQVNFDDNK